MPRDIASVVQDDAILLPRCESHPAPADLDVKRRALRRSHDREAVNVRRVEARRQDIAARQTLYLATLERLEDLAAADRRIALGAPEVPVGALTERLLATIDPSLATPAFW